jgi:beta-glucanase (GH16 family)
MNFLFKMKEKLYITENNLINLYNYNIKLREMLRLSSTFWLFFISFHLFSQCPQLVWSDEFDGNSLNENWVHDIGDGCEIGNCGWGNNELQYYRQQNVTVKDGILTITAKKEAFGSKQYTSSRIKTKGKADVKYGRIEARMKMPIGKGIWPAFWMLPTDNVYGGWPKSGEIDITEYLGHETKKIHGTLHFGNDWPNNKSTTKSFITQGPGFNEDYHIYAIEWNDHSIKWFIDGYLYSTKTPADLGSSFWPFNQKFHFILNCAVGGNWPGNPDFSTNFPQEFKIDYIRLYDLTEQPYLEGNPIVDQGSNQVYSVKKPSANSTYTWTVPADAKIISGQGSADLNMMWGNNSGKVSVEIVNNCRTQNFSIEVEALQPLSSGIVFENFDMPARIKKVFSTGTLTEDFSNPAKNDINNSDLVGQYKRNGGSQYDVLVYNDVVDVKNGLEYINGSKVFAIDVYTSAPENTLILFQLENKSKATGNYPAGRHSRYTSYTKKKNEWHKLFFTFMDQPDAGTSHSSIDQFVFLFASNSFTNDIYYWDNFESLTRSSTGELKSLNTKVFPNPSKNEIEISSDENIDSVQIFDLSGKLMFSHKLNGKKSDLLSVIDLLNGIYLLKVSGNAGISTHKIEVLK